jgi:hypothetical protein
MSYCNGVGAQVFQSGNSHFGLLNNRYPIDRSRYPINRPGYPINRPGYPIHRPGFPNYRPGFGITPMPFTTTTAPPASMPISDEDDYLAAEIGVRLPPNECVISNDQFLQHVSFDNAIV